MTVAVATGTPSYDWQYPSLMQQHDWDCSQESICWCLYAWGRTPDESWMESSMIAAGVVTPEVGCTDASGAGLARWVNDEYGEFGYWAENVSPISFDAVASEAAKHVHPLAIGGQSFYHWVGVRGHDPVMDRLLLANPAPGYKGVYQTMTRSQFAALGAFSLVRVTHRAAESGGGPTLALPFGPDVSSHQGAVDWRAVRTAGAAFGWTKATGGAWYTNPTLAANWSGMQTATVKRGAYHYAFEPSGQAYPGPGPEAEAAFFLDAVAPLGLGVGDMLALDLEEGAGPLGPWALRWCKHVEHLAGVKPVVYTGRSFAEEHGLADVPELGEYLLWLAAYDQAQMPPAPAPWSTLAFWQFTDSAQVPGVSTPVDGNWYNGTLDELTGVGKPGLAPSPSDPFLPWRGLVGSGLLEKMAEDGTWPAQRASTWLPLGADPADVETCYGANGTLYTWLLTVSQGFRYSPAA